MFLKRPLNQSLLHAGGADHCVSSHARCKRSDALSDPLLILAIAEKQPSVHLFPSQCTPEEFLTEMTRVKALTEDMITTLSPSGRAAWDEVFNFGSKDQINYAVRQVQVCAMGDGMKRDSKGFRSSSTARTIWLRKDQALAEQDTHWAGPFQRNSGAGNPTNHHDSRKKGDQ